MNTYTKGFKDCLNAINEAYIKTRPGRKKDTLKKSESDITKMLELKSNGLSYKKIARIYKVSESTVRNYLQQKKGVSKDMRRIITDKEKEYIRNSVSRGYKIKDIAKHLEISETTVHKYSKNTMRVDPLKKNKN